MTTTQSTPLEIDEGESESLPDSGTAALMDKLQSISEEVGTFVRERPLASVGIALFAGFMIGRIARRF
jgi:ElaB/YqjD/DUF883 family membrane-anchored ribosome-binding protein